MKNGCESDDSSVAKRKRYPIFKLQKDMSNYKLEVGMYFTLKSDIKEAITSYVVQNGRDLKLKK